MTTRISYIVAFLLGIGMIFIGARFLIVPEAATAGFGIQFDSHNDYSFHQVKGIRDIFSGLLICVLVLLKERRALGITLLAGAIIPTMDMSIVLSKTYNGVQQAIPHISAIIICIVFGMISLPANHSKKNL
jgi:hypothetical protein